LNLPAFDPNTSALAQTLSVPRAADVAWRADGGPPIPLDRASLRMRGCACEGYCRASAAGGRHAESPFRRDLPRSRTAGTPRPHRRPVASIRVPGDVPALHRSSSLCTVSHPTWPGGALDTPMIASIIVPMYSLASWMPRPRIQSVRRETVWLRARPIATLRLPCRQNARELCLAVVHFCRALPCFGSPLPPSVGLSRARGRRKKLAKREFSRPIPSSSEWL